VLIVRQGRKCGNEEQQYSRSIMLQYRYMSKEKTPPSQPVADPASVPVEVIVDDEVCRIELSPATFRSYERAVRRRGVTVDDLLRDAVRRFLADRYRLN
jgi:hypothetical protein